MTCAAVMGAVRLSCNDVASVTIDLVADEFCMSHFDLPLEASDPLKLGLTAAVAGDFAAARVHFWRVVAADSRHELAWQWLAKVAENQGEQEFCLARALALDPQNERRRLSLLVAQQENRDGSGAHQAVVKPPATGQCRFCDLPWAEEPVRCARCRAVQRLGDPQIFFHPLDIDTRLVSRFIDRQLAQARLDHRGKRSLVLALLNMGDLFEAVPRLRELAEMDPRDERVRVMLLAVTGQLEAIKIDSGFETEAVDRPSLEELGIA